MGKKTEKRPDSFILLALRYFQTDIHGLFTAGVEFMDTWELCQRRGFGIG